MSSSTIADHEGIREKLLRNVKKEVKQIMEESVTRKFVHEESSSITSLCGAVECCLQHGLRKRALGLFKNSTTTALLHKVSKTYEPAAQVVKLLNEAEQSSDFKKSLDNNKNQTQRRVGYNPRYLWLRLALFEKLLAKIIDFLVQHSSKYYEREALIGDPVDGPILASLLVGPCALDYTKMKTTDHYWTDPPADELVQRHRIHSSGNHMRQDSPKRPGLQVLLRRHTSSSSEESMRCVPLSAKEYVESLHQNNKSTLLYGKNNVMVQPKEDVEPLAGYLSLHQGPEGLSVKWTPNQLMNGCCEEEQEDSVDRRNKVPLDGRTCLSSQDFTRLLHSLHVAPSLRGKSQSEALLHRLVLYWDFAVTVFMDEIVYLHCHQQPDSGGTIVLVGQDGVQRPPIHFPKGGHLLSFLSCLENGLLPHGQLDPPLWSQRGKGKVFPKMKRKGCRMAQTSITTQLSEDKTGSSPSIYPSMASVDESGVAPLQGGQGIGEEEEEATDYVFRIIAAFRPESITADMFDPKARDKGSTGSAGSSTSSSGLSSSIPWPLRDLVQRPPLAKATPKPTPPSAIQTYAKSQQDQNNTCISKTGQSRTAVKQLCDTMTRQILSRAFYGWLSHCRHLKTVRTHLSGLVNTIVVSGEVPSDASSGLTLEKWTQICKNGMVKEEAEVYRLVYYGGCSHDCRKEVWPYLLGHYKFHSTPEERQEHDDLIKTQYEKTMSEWMAVEAIVRQRDKEIMAANLAKLSQESTDGQIPLVRKDSSLSNDVFESMDSDDFSHPETVPEESSNAASSLTSPTSEFPPTSTAICPKEAHQALSVVKSSDSKDTSCSPDEGLGDSIARMSSLSESKRSDSCDTDKNIEMIKLESEDGAEQRNIIITNPSMDQLDEAVQEVNGDMDEEEEEEETEDTESSIIRNKLLGTRTLEDTEHLSASRESLNCPASPASNASNGGVYSTEMLDSVALNLHRIDKDVQRCDRNYWYFTPANLDKLRNVMCTYVWEHLEVGYVQGMCDLVAPLLVIFDDEAKSYSCFCQLMKRMSSNFPHGGAMDTHFANMRSLIQILDPELFEHMHQNGDYTHFYFCYRWFLLDFKRELVYDDVFSVWETIWTAKHTSSPHFVLFIALALVEYYREIIIDNNMDFTDIIKFFNEMAERHSSKQVLRIARDLVYKLQDLIENK